MRRNIIFLLGGALFFLSQFYRASTAVIAPDLMRDLGVGSRDLSLISAAFFYAFALMQIPIGIVLDVISARRAMTVLSLISAIGAVIFGLGQSITVLTVGRVLMGTGMACNLIGTLKLITMWFPAERFGTLSAFVFSLGTLGNLAAATPLVFLAESIGWRYSFLLIAGVNLTLVLLFYLVVRDRPASALSVENPVQTGTGFSVIRENFRSLFGQRDYWIISLGTFCRYGIYAAVLSLWAAPFLVHIMGVSSVVCGNLLLLMSVGLVVGSPIFGWLSDSVLRNRKGVVIAGLAAMSGILILLTRLPAGTSTAVLGMVFFGFGFFSSSGGIMYAHIKERMPVEQAGAAMTGINFFTMIGVAFFLQGMGYIMQYLHPEASLGEGAFRDAFWFCAAGLLGTAIVYGFTRETVARR